MVDASGRGLDTARRERSSSLWTGARVFWTPILGARDHGERLSAIAGIRAFGGRPVHVDELRPMMSALAHRETDESGAWAAGSIALGCRRCGSAMPIGKEALPLRAEGDRFVLAFDGRIDNREELGSALGVSRSMLSERTDAEIVLSAYQRWGEGVAEKLLGDFAFAVWDGERRTLFCARDPMGIRPFYYAMVRDAFVFASELGAVLRIGSVSRRINEGMVGEYLACAITSKTQTLYADVQRLPPAHSLSVREGHLQIRSHWSPIPSKEIRHATDDDYAAHFLDLFREAVRCRLRGVGSVGIELSGGIDSSLLTSVAALLARESGSPSIRARSITFPGLECDESGYIQSLARELGIEVHVHRPTIATTSYRDRARKSLDFPGHPNGVMAGALREEARANGERVLLTGTGGDDWFAGASGVARARDLFRHPWKRDLFRAVSRRDVAPALRTMASEALSSFGIATEARHRRRARLLHRTMPWLDREFLGRIDLGSRLSLAPLADAFRDHEQAEVVREGLHPWQTHALEIEERDCAQLGIETRHPFLDRRLVEFAIAVPGNALHRAGESKFVVRRAMAGLVPEGIRKRRDKAQFGDVFFQTLEALGGESMFSGMAIASAGWVNVERAREAYRAACRLHQGPNSAARDLAIALAWRLWMVVGVEIWYANHEP